MEEKIISAIFDAKALGNGKRTKMYHKYIIKPPLK